MKTFLLVCLAIIGFAGLSSGRADAATPTAAQVATLPSVVHINQAVVVETGHRHYYHRHYHHRRYYYRHHRRYYY